MREHAFAIEDGGCGCDEHLTALDTGRAAPQQHDAARSDMVRIEIRPSEILIRIRTDSADVSMVDARDTDARAHDDAPLVTTAKALARAAPRSRGGTDIAWLC